MRKLRATPFLLCAVVCLAFSAFAQTEDAWVIKSLSDEGLFDYSFQTGVARGTNLLVMYGGAVLTADTVTINQESGEAAADGRVRIQRDEQLWAGDHIRYNFKTRQMQTEQFRTGKAPLFAGGFGLLGDVTNRVYYATNAFVTTDDYAAPFGRVGARHLKIVPGQYVEVRHATFYVGPVPVFYLPYYRRELSAQAGSFNLVPGYRSRYGPFLLGSYTWFLNEYLDSTVHVDYRARRGVGAGPDFNAHLGRWGEAALRYYYLHDDDPGEDLYGAALPDNRQRLYFSYLAAPFTNLTLRSQVRYQSDSRVDHDFFEADYRRNPQPTTFVEATRFWQNFALDIYAQPRVNDFLETVERLPEIKLTGWRQQLGASPLYYESESSAGYYRRRFADTNAPGPPDYSATRADTYHQVVLPWTFFGWLNVTPRVGGRFTYYGNATATNAVADEIYRGVFNTGAEVSFKASRTWAGVTNGLLQLDGLRHIVEPSVNYVYVPAPNHRPPELPQFDSELPSLCLLPVEFPDYNAVDSVDSQNVLRFGLRNRLQTRREGQVENLLDWAVFTDWRLRPRDDQTTFADLYSDLQFRPRAWLTLASQMRFDVDCGQWRLAFHTLTLAPKDVWSWSIGHYYLRDDLRPVPTALGEGNNLIYSSLFYRLNENWGFRATHHFEARDGRMEEQYYTVYRDFRSWTGAVTFRLRDNRNEAEDFTVAFTLSLKMRPRLAVGADAVRPYGLLGD